MAKGDRAQQRDVCAAANRYCVGSVEGRVARVPDGHVTNIERQKQEHTMNQPTLASIDAELLASLKDAVRRLDALMESEYGAFVLCAVFPDDCRSLGAMKAAISAYEQEHAG
jgi:hypothetical protein